MRTPGAARLRQRMIEDMAARKLKAPLEPSALEMMQIMYVSLLGAERAFLRDVKFADCCQDRMASYRPGWFVPSG